MKSGNNNKATFNSLQQMWGVDIQKRWNKLRERSIEDALELLSEQPDISFAILHEFLIRERVSIAAKLSPDIAKDIRRSRSSNEDEVICGDGYLPTSAVTAIKNEFTYKDFFQDLYAEFNRYNPVKGEELVALKTSSSDVIINYGDKDKSNDYGLGIQFSEDLSTFYADRLVCIFKSQRYLNITYDDTPYTLLMEVMPYTLLNEKQKLNKNIEPLIIICHCFSSNIETILNRVSNLYDKLQSISSSAVLAKIQIIKDMMWHLSHATTQCRGSAAITELLFETLLRRHSLSYEKTRIPLDLIALFSISPEEFDRKFTINTAVETLGKKINEFINQADAANTAGTASIGLFATDKEKSHSHVELAKKLSQLLHGNSTDMLTNSEVEELKRGPLGEWINQCDPKAIPYLFTSVDKVNINSPIIK